MTSKTQHLKPITRAHKRRAKLPWYIDLSGKGLFWLVVLGAVLLGLLALAQTGRVVTAGYQLRQLQKQERDLLWQQEDLLKQLAEATAPAALEQWALEQKMVLLKPQEITAIPLVGGDLASRSGASTLAEQP